MRVRVLDLLVVLGAASLSSAEAEEVRLELKPISDPVGYVLEREVKLDDTLLSSVRQEFTVTAAPDTQGTRVTMTIRRLGLSMDTPGGEEIRIDAKAGEPLGKIDNPMARSMMDGVDKLLGTPIWWVEDAAGRISDRGGIDEARKKLPGHGGAPGLCAQVLMEIDQLALEAHQVLPPQPVRGGEKWSAEMTLFLGPGTPSTVPLALEVVALEGGRAHVAGDFEIDPSLIPASQLGKPTAASGRVEYDFDIALGRFARRSAVISIDVDRGTKGRGRLETRRTLTAEPAVSGAADAVGD